jgi:hypothetical protein
MLQIKTISGVSDAPNPVRFGDACGGNPYKAGNGVARSQNVVKIEVIIKKYLTKYFNCIILIS